MSKRKKVKIILDGFLNLETGELKFPQILEGDKVKITLMQGGLK